MMDIFGLFLLFYLGYRNSVRAKQKGQNGILWAVITIVSYIITEAVGLFIVIMFFCRDVVDLNILTRTNSNFDAASKLFNQQVEKALMDNPLRELTVVLFGIGGFLFVRYLIDRKPDKKEPEVHWMDKMGEQ